MIIKSPLHLKNISGPASLCFLILIYSSGLYAESYPASLKYFQTDIRYEYRYKLLKLALQKTESSDGPLFLKALPYKVTQKRGLAYLKDGGIDIVSLATSKKREQDFLPVRIPILKGILGYRVFLIHRKDTRQLKQIKSLKDLTDNFIAGFGVHWADYKILQANNIPVETSALYENLFTMLIAGRFDYFPRGINEAWNEIEKYSSEYPFLTVEDNIAFYYPYPTYFFVNKNNTKLAHRIERGLNLALADGTFKTLFLDDHQDMINRANLEERLMFRLKNPGLPTSTPEIDTSWWLKKSTDL